MADELSKYTTQELEVFSGRLRELSTELEGFSKRLLDLMMDAMKIGMHMAAAEFAVRGQADEVVYEATAKEVVYRRENSAARLDHEAVRSAAGYYDFTHKLLEVTGMGARSFLNRMFVAPIAKAKVGQAKYTTMLNGNGEIIDDVIVFRIEEDKYWVSTLYIHELIAWFDAHRTLEDVSYREITRTTAMYAVQGPASRTILNGFLNEDVSGLKQFEIRDNAIGSTKVKIARSGYTGELGYEIYCNPDDSELVERALEKTGAAHGIRKITTDVIVTSLPREKGYVLMSDIGGLNPLECGFDWSVDWSKDFVGKSALEKVRARGADRALVGFTVEEEGAAIEPGCDVLVNGVKAGKVTVFTYGYTVKKFIGFAVIEKKKAKIGDAALISSHGRQIPAVLTERIWYDPRNMRIKGGAEASPKQETVRNVVSRRTTNTEARLDHETVRNAVGYYDFTHKLLEVTGADAGSFLDKMFVASIGKAKVGQAKYTTMLNECGDIIDDVIVFRVEDRKYWVSTLYIHELISWFDVHRESEQVSYKEITGMTTMYAVQGPNSRKVLNRMLAHDISDQKYFTIVNNQIDHIPVKIARSGYTGELGYEIYCSPADAAAVEEKLETCGREYGIRKITTDVIVTSLPREKGFVLMSDLEGCNPLEVGFGWAVDWNKDFVGKAALERARSRGVTRSLLGFVVEDKAAEVPVGADVTVNGRPVGTVTMYTYGYTVEKNIGFALVDHTRVQAGDTVQAGSVSVTLTERMFYDLDNHRMHG